MPKTYSPTPFLHPSRVLEEARKSWDYVSCEEVVYLVEGGQRDGALGGGLPIFEREAYLNRKLWFEVVLHLGPDFGRDNQRHTGALIIESERFQSRRRRSAKPISGFAEHGGHKPVFIGVRDISEYGEEFKLRPLPFCGTAEALRWAAFCLWEQRR